MNKLSRPAFAPVALFCLLLSFSGCGKGNLFSWAHNAGSGTSNASLTSDANTALQNKDYSKALSYYTKLLENNPNNSEAIYGYAVAKLGEQGLDIASLINNLINQSSNQNPAQSRLVSALGTLSSSSSSDNLLPSQIILHATSIMAAIDNILSPSKLPKIVKGTADGVIKQDDMDVNINIAFCLVLRSALRLNTYVTFDTNNGATVNAAGKALSHQQLQDLAVASAQDIASAYYYMQIVITKINSSDSSNKTSNLSDIKSNVNSIFTNFANALKPYNIDISGVHIGQNYL